MVRSNEGAQALTMLGRMKNNVDSIENVQMVLTAIKDSFRPQYGGFVLGCQEIIRRDMSNFSCRHLTQLLSAYAKISAEPGIETYIIPELLRSANARLADFEEREVLEALSANIYLPPHAGKQLFDNLTAMVHQSSQEHEDIVDLDFLTSYLGIIHKIPWETKKIREESLRNLLVLLEKKTKADPGFFGSIKKIQNLARSLLLMPSLELPSLQQLAVDKTEFIAKFGDHDAISLMRRAVSRRVPEEEVTAYEDSFLKNLTSGGQSQGLGRAMEQLAVLPQFKNASPQALADKRAELDAHARGLLEEGPRLNAFLVALDCFSGPNHSAEYEDLLLEILEKTKDQFHPRALAAVYFKKMSLNNESKLHAALTKVLKAVNDLDPMKYNQFIFECSSHKINTPFQASTILIDIRNS